MGPASASLGSWSLAGLQGASYVCVDRTSRAVELVSGGGPWVLCSQLWHFGTFIRGLQAAFEGGERDASAD